MRTQPSTGPRTLKRWARNESGEVFWRYYGSRECWCSEDEAERLNQQTQRNYRRGVGRAVERKWEDAASRMSFHWKNVPSDFRRMAARGLSDADIAVRMMAKMSRVREWRAAMEKETKA